MKYVIKIVRAENDRDLENKLTQKVNEVVSYNSNMKISDIQISITATTLGVDGAYNLIGCIRFEFKDQIIN